MSSENTQTFSFKYAVFMVKGQIEGDHLSVQMNIRQVHVRLDQLKHLYIDDRRSNESVELIVSYLNKKGKLKRFRVFSDHQEAGFKAMVAAILERRPEIELTGLTPEEAYVRMGSNPLAWYALPLVMCIALLLVTVACMPLLLHGFDHRRVDVELSTLDAESTERTVRVRGGRLLTDKAVSDAGDRPVVGPMTLWIPLVGPDWTDGSDIKVVVQMMAKQIDDVAEGAPIEGLLRNVWWEGLTNKMRVSMRAKELRTAHDAILIDSRSTPSDDLGLALFILITLGVITGGTTFLMYLKFRRS